MSIRILVADDHTLVRKGLKALLEKGPDMVPVGEAVNGREAVDLALSLKPDVVLMDVAMPGMNGIEAIREILAQLPETRIIALSMYSDRRLIVEAISAGASAYLLKDCAFDELAQTIRTIFNGGETDARPVSGIIISDKRENLDPLAASAFLSARERQVLQLIAEGRNTKEVAFLLEVSIKTVETHRQNIMEKLNIHSIAELTKYAIREGLTSL